MGMREDPTFRVSQDAETNGTIISGMGELHLQIYVERIRREYKCELVTGPPRVNYRETITQRYDFEYTHKKQSGGAGQYGKVVGFVEPLPREPGTPQFEFVNALVGNNIPPEYHSACEKGFKEAQGEGALTGHPVEGVRVTLTDGQSHVVDSSEMAFRTAARMAFRKAFNFAGPAVLEPVMKVEVVVPSEFQGNVVGSLNKRRGAISGTDETSEGATISADVPLSNMMGFSTDLRSMTQRKGEFTMEYKDHQFVPRDTQEKLAK